MAWRTEHVAEAPPGWRVRTVQSGEHELRVAFPPGLRRKGSGQLIEILHPKAENGCGMRAMNPGGLVRAMNPGGLVIFANPGKPNPAELVIFGNPKRKRKRNQVNETEQAVELYTKFHGKDPQGIMAAQRSAAMRLDYAALGPLVGVGLYVEGARIPSPDHWDSYAGAVEIEQKSHIMLASNAEGTQLYAIGGTQDEFRGVADELDQDLSKDILDLGELAFVVYLGQKPPRYESTEYMHQFDEPRPSLGYDQVKREVFFAGGRYSVAGLWLHN